MDRTRRVDGDRVFAICIVIVLHLLAVRLLTDSQPPKARSARALEVVWIESPTPVPEEPATVAQPQDAARARIAPRVAETTASPSLRNPPKPAPAANGADTRSLSLVVLEQGRQWARDQVPRDDFVRNPLTRQTAPRAEARTDRFVMQKEIAPADIVAGIGALFGGGGDLVDCARIRDNIMQLATGGPSELLDEELRRDRRLCR